ncbi:MAG: hypothetical protein PF517_06245 [Salinivirgaceae bacterium]|jgi:hypothetical protein|nr:hypothetical protein [Salinivirgaceae bacterium]
MTENNKQTKKELLFSKDEKVVIKAIENLRETGNDSDLELLTELYTETKLEKVKKSIYHFFCDLRNQSSADIITRIIKSTSDKDTLKMLTSSTWESRLNYIGYFELFIDLVIYEGFEIAFEAFTLIESFEEKTTEARKETLAAYVKENIEKCKEENLAFAMDLVKIIEDYKV